MDTGIMGNIEKRKRWVPVEDSGNVGIKSDSDHEEPFFCMQPYTQLLISCKQQKHEHYLALL